MDKKRARKFLRRNAWKLAKNRVYGIDGWLEQRERVAWNVIMWGHLPRFEQMVLNVERM